MIESIRLKNFQQHVEEFIRFDELTVLIGDTGAGKSSVMRALLWACMNRPTGTGMIRHGEDYARATLKVDGKKVVRQKDRRTGHYKLGKKKYKALYGAVPEDIASLVNVSDVNFQQQHDGSFWFSDSPGKVSKELNRIVNLDVIDTALANVKSESKRATMTVAIRRIELKAAKEALSSLEWVGDFAKLAEQGVELERQLEETRGTAEGLRSKLSLVRELVKAQDDTSAICELGTAFLTLGEEWRKLTDERDRLRTLVRNARTQQKAASAEVPEDAMDTLNSLADLYYKRERLNSLIRDCKTEERILWQAEKAVTETTARLEKQTVCPACGNRLTKS
jgi:DNA repair exonuclease SbcCD ATPase subunit